MVLRGAGGMTCLVRTQTISSAAQRRNAAQSHGILRRPPSVDCDAEYMTLVPYIVVDKGPQDAGLDSCSRDHSPGSTNRMGGKRWIGARPFAVPPCRPTSRPVGHLGRRKSASRFSSSQQPHQHRDTQRNPGADQKPFDRSANLHGGNQTR